MKRETICLIIACLISFILTSGIMNWRMEIVHAELSDTQQSLAKEVFRFHVIAESDSANDQKIKLKVRDAVLKYMKAHMTRAERRDAKATKAWTLTHKKELTDTADKILKKEKVSYRAKAEVTTCYFPDKRYGDIIFPEGNYEALRIVLGKGNGHNWWCVLYPNLCFTNATCAVVDEDGKKELKERFPVFLKKNLSVNPMKCEYFLPEVVSNLLSEGKATVEVRKSLDKWYGVTYKEDKPFVVAAIQSLKDQGLYQQKLWEE